MLLILNSEAIFGYLKRNIAEPYDLRKNLIRTVYFRVQLTFAFPDIDWTPKLKVTAAI